MHAIVLAHEKSFTIGPVAVHPSTRSVSRGHRHEILEPRVMQVLVMLAGMAGEVVSRDDLLESCWGGRIVGDDAVNRVIGRLRRAAEGIGEGVLAVDTITRVGFRLRLLDEAATVQRVEDSDGMAPGPRIGRREAVVGAALAGGAAVLGGGWLLLRDHAPRSPVSPERDALMQQALLALRQGTREGQTQAIGLYRRVVADSPDYADGWGALAIAYAFIAHYRPAAEAAVLRQQASAAGERARSIDAGNVFAEVALATARPAIRNWHLIEIALVGALGQHPRDEQSLFSLALVLASVGRTQASLAAFERLAAFAPPTPVYMFNHIAELWSAGRIEETDALIADASRLYPTHFAIWFIRFYVLLFSGRPAAAIALGEDSDSRPSGIPDEEIEAVVRVARAMVSRAPTAIDAVIREQFDRAHHAAGAAENAAQFAAALGRVDDSFRILDGYYFAEGFDPGEVRFTNAQGTFTPRSDRLTAFLFNPALAALRGDTRFHRLAQRLGLADYWRQTGTPPDYLTAKT